MSEETVRVELSERSYDVRIGTGTLAAVGQQLARIAPVSHVVLVTDENVEQPHAAAVAQSFAEADVRTELLVVPPGEASKALDVAEGLWQQLLELGSDRGTVVVAVGGGVVGDLAGFVASAFARGLRFVQVPTTLLAQVDSSIGGKVGVNLPAAKNMVGAFWQPLAVFIDTAVLATLPEREYRAGLGEVVKYGVILDAEFFAYLEEHTAEINARKDDVLRHVVTRCCRLKADVVQLDEREESGHRAVLNYGHTFAHAVEVVQGYDGMLHGEAVAAGMLCASRLAERLGRIDVGLTERQRDLLAALHLPVRLPKLDAGQLLDAMAHDKKVRDGRLRFVLPTRLGHVELLDDVQPDDVRAVLEEMIDTAGSP